MECMKMPQILPFSTSFTSQAKGKHCAKFINQADQARDAEQNANGIDFQIPSAERNRRGGEGEGPQFNDEFFESHTFRPLDKS